METVIIIALAFCVGIIIGGIMYEIDSSFFPVIIIATFVLFGMFIGTQIATTHTETPTPLTTENYE